MASELSPIASLGLAALVKSMQVKPFLHLKAFDLLFGYDDQLVRLASKFVPSLIPFDSFGIFQQVSDLFISQIAQQIWNLYYFIVNILTDYRKRK